MKLLRQTKRTPVQSFKATLSSTIVVIGLEVAMKHWLAANDVVAVLLAGGGNAPYLHVILALVFVLLRIFVFLILPGIIARELFLALVKRVPQKPA